MDITVPSYVSGPLLLAALFIICCFVVVGAKTLSVTLKKRFYKKPAPPPAPAPEIREKPKPRAYAKKPRTVKSIEINPDDVDRIYVRKSS